MKISEPFDGWGQRNGNPVAPRRWQREALPVILNHYSRPNPSRGAIQAVTGAGKSLILAAVCACIQLEKNEVVVITTSRQKLVRDIKKAVKDRLDNNNEFMADPVVGAFFANEKCDLNTCRFIVACNDSLGVLAEALGKYGKTCAFFICDELHRSQSKSMLKAISLLLPVMSLGLSATPFRAKESQEISSFDEIIYKLDMQAALNDKDVVVPWVAKGWDGDEVSLDEACLALMQEENGFGVCNAVSIADAEQFSKFCNDSGYSTKTVHSKKTDKENDDILEELRTGAIKAVVFVDLLCEGVDLPFLRFLCMRRVVGSRNRFIQELGRGIRYYKDPITGEEKTHVVLIDPNDLLSIHRISHPACLAGDGDIDESEIEDEGEKNEGKKLERSLQKECFDVLRFLTQVKSGKEVMRTEPLASYLSQLCSVFDTFGLMDKPLSSRDWRRAPASDKQVKTMKNMKWALGRKQVPSIHKTALEILTDTGTVMNRGMASDLISIEMSLAEKSTWPKFSRLDECVRYGLEKHEKRKAGIKRPKPVSAFTVKPNQKLEQGVLFENTSTK